MRVRATADGQYANVYIEAGHVFDLLKNADGSDPLREDWVPRLDKNGKDTGDGQYVTYKDADGNTVHRDYAPDSGDFLIKQGPRRGEVERLGWMEEVSEDTEITIDVSEFRYGWDVKKREMRRAQPKPIAGARAAKPLAKQRLG